MDAVFGIEFNHAVFQGEQSKIPALLNEFAGKKIRAFLADQDAASRNKLASKTFHAKTLGVGIATVS